MMTEFFFVGVATPVFFSALLKPLKKDLLTESDLLNWKMEEEVVEGPGVIERLLDVIGREIPFAVLLDGAKIG